MNRVCLMLVTVIWSFSAAADADGPDFFRVQNVAASSLLPVSAEPRAGESGLGTIPSNTQCLRNLGCRGGLSLEDFDALSKGDQGLLSVSGSALVQGARHVRLMSYCRAPGGCTTIAEMQSS